MDIAITRDVSPAIARCELSFLERTPIDYERAVAQHADYCRALEALGLELLRLPADPALPDCCFVEDTAVVLDELAVVTAPGAASRRGEVAAVAEALARHRRIERIERHATAAPGAHRAATLDGGDVLQLGRRLFVGGTSRSSAAGMQALARIVAPFGYDVTPVAVAGCLHLKSAVSAVDDETVLLNPAWLDVRPFAAYRQLPVDPREPGAANVLRVRGRLVGHAGYPRTLEALERAGQRVVPLDISEFVKAEAAVTCKSLLLRRL